MGITCVCRRFEEPPARVQLSKEATLAESKSRLPAGERRTDRAGCIPTHLTPFAGLRLPRPQVGAVGAAIQPHVVRDSDGGVQVALARAVRVALGRREQLPREVHQAQPPQLVELHGQLEAGLAVHARAAVGAAVQVQVRPVQRHRVAVAPMRMIHPVCERGSEGAVSQSRCVPSVSRAPRGRGRA